MVSRETQLHKYTTPGGIKISQGWDKCTKSTNHWFVELLFLHTNRPHYTIQLQYVSYTGSMTRKHGVYKLTRVKVCTAV